MVSVYEQRMNEWWRKKGEKREISIEVEGKKKIIRKASETDVTRLT
jgi:hypothetical protein